MEDEQDGAAEVRAQRSYISGTIFTSGLNQPMRGHVLDASAVRAGAVTCITDVGNCLGCKEPYYAGSDSDDGEGGRGEDDDEAVSSSEERDQLPLTSMAKRFSLVHSMKIPSGNGGCAGAGGGKPAEFDHARWLFETKGTYGYGNALWPKDGHGGGGGGGGTGFAGFEEPPNFGSRCRRPLTRKTSVSQAILSPYR